MAAPRNDEASLARRMTAGWLTPAAERWEDSKNARQSVETAGAEIRPDGTRRRDRKRLLFAIRVPEIHDLANRLRFAPEQGRIWLDDQRMMLMHVSSLGALRQELIGSLGKETARGVITRIGYQAGARDAEMAKKLRSDSGTYDHFLAGPQLVSLEGIVHCEPLALDIDVGSGRYFGDFALIDCAEAEAHVAAFGIGEEPSCWMLVGYACGYTSTFMGRPDPLARSRMPRHGRTTAAASSAGRSRNGATTRAKTSASCRSATSSNGRRRRPAARRRRPAWRRVTPAQENDFGMVGISTGFNKVCHLVKKVAPTEATVLFLGESGVGKEIFCPPPASAEQPRRKAPSSPSIAPPFPRH